MTAARDEDHVLPPRPLITRTPADLDYWQAKWNVERAALEDAVRRYGPSVTAVARALDRPAEV